MFDVTNFNDSANKTSNNLSIFLARVALVYVDDTDFKAFDKKDGKIQDTIIIHNDNDKIADTDTRYYGAISFKQQDTLDDSNAFTAYPFDKNNFTLPLVGETVIIIEMENEWFYLPYSKTLYPNYRNDYKTSQKLDQSKVQKTDTKNTANDYSKVSKTGISSTTNASAKDTDIAYNINEKIKFLKPRKGDTILTGRVGNTIRFSEFFLTEDGKTSSPSIFIRNKQNPKLDSEKIGTLVDEDINKDGTSIYITSNKVKIPFKETIGKVKVAFKDFPSSDKLKGDQLFVNSDRIILSAKASEFIIFGKGNTGIITDGKFSVDSIGDSHIHSDNNIVLQTKKNIVLASDDIGTIWLGGVKKTKGKAGESYQRMVLAGELIQILEELIDEITKIIVPTPVGPSGTPINAAVFKAIKGKLPKIQSARNFLSKS
jgi:hypothetical protein